MKAKGNLKRILRDHLGKTASELFVNKSLEIIDESADTKESFCAAAERIRRRITLFIDAELAKKLHDILTQEIERMPLAQGNKRRHPRVVFCNKVSVTYNGKEYELYTKDLSEGGVCIETKEPCPVGAKLKITLPLEPGINVPVNGIVVRSIRPSAGRQQSSMGIEFKELREDDLRILRDFLKRALSQENSLTASPSLYQIQSNT